MARLWEFKHVRILELELLGSALTFVDADTVEKFILNVHKRSTETMAIRPLLLQAAGI